MKPNKKEALTQFHRENIIKAAERLFIANGIQKTTMDDISKEAGYSKSTVYVYFQSKEEICNAISLSGMVLLKEQILNAVSTSQDFFKRYYAMCNAVVFFQETYPLHFASLLDEIDMRIDSEQAPPVLRDIFLAGEELNGVIYDFIKQGMQSDILRQDILLPQSVFVFWSSLSGIVRMAAQKEAYIEKTMEISKLKFLEYGFDILLRAFLKNNLE